MDTSEYLCVQHSDTSSHSSWKMSWRRKKLPLGMREIAIIGISLPYNTFNTFLHIQSYTYCYSHNLRNYVPITSISMFLKHPGCYVSPHHHPGAAPAQQPSPPSSTLARKREGSLPRPDAHHLRGWLLVVSIN